jgi:isopenicillin N synthase-like dioxygenase
MPTNEELCLCSHLIEDYTQGMEKILFTVWKALSVYLGLAPDTLMKAQERDDDESHLIIRLNYYPKCSEPERVLGVGAHKDFGSLTILLQDEVGGLQVQKPGTTGWLDVSSNKGENKGRLLIHIANQVQVIYRSKAPG